MENLSFQLDDILKINLDFTMLTKTLKFLIENGQKNAKDIILLKERVNELTCQKPVIVQNEKINTIQEPIDNNELKFIKDSITYLQLNVINLESNLLQTKNSLETRFDEYKQNTDADIIALKSNIDENFIEFHETTHLMSIKNQDTVKENDEVFNQIQKRLDNVDELIRSFSIKFSTMKDELEKNPRVERIEKLMEKLSLEDIFKETSDGIEMEKRMKEFNPNNPAEKGDFLVEMNTKYLTIICEVNKLRDMIRVFQSIPAEDEIQIYSSYVPFITRISHLEQQIDNIHAQLSIIERIKVRASTMKRSETLKNNDSISLYNLLNRTKEFQISTFEEEKEEKGIKNEKEENEINEVSQIKEEKEVKGVIKNIEIKEAKDLKADKEKDMKEGSSEVNEVKYVKVEKAEKDQKEQKEEENEFKNEDEDDEDNKSNSIDVNQEILNLHERLELMTERLSQKLSRNDFETILKQGLYENEIIYPNKIKEIENRLQKAWYRHRVKSVPTDIPSDKKDSTDEELSDIHKLSKLFEDKIQKTLEIAQVSDLKVQDLIKHIQNCEEEILENSKKIALLQENLKKASKKKAEDNDKAFEHLQELEEIKGKIQDIFQKVQEGSKLHKRDYGTLQDLRRILDSKTSKEEVENKVDKHELRQMMRLLSNKVFFYLDW